MLHRVNTEVVSVSYNKLRQEMDRIDDYFMNGSDADVRAIFRSAALREDLNVLVVTLKDVEDETIERFEQAVIASEFIEYRLADDEPTEYQSVSPGDPLGVSDGSSGSATYRSTLQRRQTPIVHLA